MAARGRRHVGAIAVAIAPHTSAGISLLADGTAAANFIRRRHNLVALSVVGGVNEVRGVRCGL